MVRLTVNRWINRDINSVALFLFTLPIRSASAKAGGPSLSAICKACVKQEIKGQALQAWAWDTERVGSSKESLVWDTFPIPSKNQVANQVDTLSNYNYMLNERLFPGLLQSNFFQSLTALQRTTLLRTYILQSLCHEMLKKKRPLYMFYKYTSSIHKNS